jgi:hypothetical protein
MDIVHTGYAVVVARKLGAGLEVEQVNYRAHEEDTAWIAYDAMCALRSVLCATLEGPGGEVLATWERRTEG